jgi:hypothetical protein
LLQDLLNHKACWGYEEGCKFQDSYSIPSCPGDHKGWVKTKADQLKTFYTQGDFGYIQEQRQEMMVMCEPTYMVINMNGFVSYDTCFFQTLFQWYISFVCHLVF